jgi:thioredoxin-like negative regulator of GroEL
MTRKMPQNLATQELFESMWFHTDPTKPPQPGTRPSDRAWIVQYSAKWCGPCRRLDSETIDAAAKAKGLTVWKCDIDANEYTPGYCGVRSIPTFHFCTPGKIMSEIQSADTQQVCGWISKFSNITPNN